MVKEPVGSPARNIIVVGASAGGIEAIVELTRGLPHDLQAAVFVVVHIPESPRSVIPNILNRAGGLRATHAVHGELIEPGRIYVAPNDNHMMVRPGRVQVVRGPLENGHRPAVDALFRSAASAYGPRVVGVVLTGGRDCGTKGLQIIKSCGGLVIVQDPHDALVPEMPRAALKYNKPDYVVPLSEIPPLLTRLVGHQTFRSVTHEDGDLETTPRADQKRTESEECRSFVTCPHCHGSMKESESSGLLRFECHVGHGFTLNSLMAEQTAEVEAALWASIRALEESEALARQMARRSTKPELASRYSEKAAAMRQHAATIKNIVLGPDQGFPTEPD